MARPYATIDQLRQAVAEFTRRYNTEWLRPARPPHPTRSPRRRDDLNPSRVIDNRRAQGTGCCSSRSCPKPTGMVGTGAFSDGPAHSNQRCARAEEFEHAHHLWALWTTRSDDLAHPLVQFGCHPTGPRRRGNYIQSEHHLG